MLKLDELICAGKDEEGNPCKRQLAKDMKFCPECGTLVKKPVAGDQSVSRESPQLPEQSTEDLQANDSSDDEDNGQGGAGDHNSTGSGSVVTLEQTQYARCRFVVDDVLTKIMREYMEQSALPRAIIEQTIMKYKTFKNRLSQEEMSIIQTLQTDGFKHFEISLMYKIARNRHFSMLIPDKPTRDWGSDPQPNESTIGDNMERIRMCRNKTSHKAYPSLQEKELNNLFTTFIDIAKRAKEHLKTENFEDSILHYKTCSLDKDMEEKLKKYIQQMKSLKKLLDTVLKTNLRLKVYIDQLSQANVEDIRHKGTAEGVMKSTITVTGIENAQEKAELLNLRKSELATESIVFNYADEGSLLIYLDITTSLFQDQNLLCRQIKQFMQLVFEVSGLQCSTGECNAFLSILEENYDTASEGDNSSFDESCSSTNNLVLHVEVKEEAMMTDELLSQNVHDFLGNVVTKMNGTPITQGEEITAIIGVEETGENKVESIQHSDSFKEDKLDGDIKKNENFETRKQYRDDVTRKFSNEKEVKEEGETNSATDCSDSELSSSGTENIPIGQHKRKQYKDGHQKKKMKVTDRGESSVIKEETSDDRKRKQSMIGKGKKKVKVEDEGGSSVDPQTSGDSSTQIGHMETVFGTTKDEVNIQEKYEEPQAGPSTSRFEDSFIFRNIGKNTNENSSGGESSVPIKEAKESETKQKKKGQAEKEKTVTFKKEGKQDKDTSEDDSSDNNDSDSRKSWKDNIEKEEESAGKKKKRKNRKKKGSSKGDTDTKTKPETKTDKPDKMDGTRLTTAGNGSGNADKTQGRRQISSTSIEVCFNAVISPTILSNPETDAVVVVFPENGNREFKLKLDRFMTDGYIVGSVTVPIAKDLVSGNYRPLHYNYKVYHGEARNKATVEYFHKSGGKDGYMRQVLIPSKYLSQGKF
ncbi:MATH and LRR domain-containing protein PFE0570w-like [Mytilus trossulus]|uniref:MATH and LRR domain-containing protein PFE0570w-like n=1 Tax=Mytilus trossulus TaxID=6551 RepID=UPI0030051F64